MVRLLTAGESHGRGLVGVIEGLPSGIPISTKAIRAELARRRMGYGRSGRQKLEADPVRIRSGVRHGRTLGSPIAIEIANAEWKPKYRELMGVEGEIDPADKLTRPRPGHADLAGALKYGFDDVRNVLERASARETTMRVALGAFCKAFLAELGIQVVSHVIQIGSVTTRSKRRPRPEDLDAVDASPVRCLDPDAGARMTAEIDRIRKSRDTVGGIFEVLAYGCPPGLGNDLGHDRKLDARIAMVLMSIQSVKGVEIGDGIEGGTSTGQTIRARAAMKPFSTVPRPLRTVDLRTGEPAVAISQRTDTCAVPAGAVVGEAVLAHVLADAVLERSAGTSLTETRRNLEAFTAPLP